MRKRNPCESGSFDEFEGFFIPDFWCESQSLSFFMELVCSCIFFLFNSLAIWHILFFFLICDMGHSSSVICDSYFCYLQILDTMKLLDFFWQGDIITLLAGEKMCAISFETKVIEGMCN